MAFQERILRNKTWQDFRENCWLFLIINYSTHARGILVNCGTPSARDSRYPLLICLANLFP